MFRMIWDLLVGYAIAAGITKYVSFTLALTLWGSFWTYLILATCLVIAAVLRILLVKALRQLAYKLETPEQKLQREIHETMSAIINR